MLCTPGAIRPARLTAPAVIALVTLVAAVSPSPARAHSVTVDGSFSDWPLLPPTPANLGRVARGASGIGEFVWSDGFNDEANNADDGADMTAFRVTATTTHLSFFARMANISVVANAGAPIVQVAIDLDRVAGSGELALFGNAETQVLDEARWEFLVQTRFGLGSNQVETFDATLTSRGVDAAGIVPTGPDGIEFSIPWSRIGLTGPPIGAVRFTVATFVSLAGNAVADLGGPGVSNVYDCVTNYGNPGTQPNTSPTETGDGIVGYAFDVHFHATGEAYSPLLVSEALVNPSTISDAAGEWIEITNVSGQSRSLDGYKLGDEETPDGGECMSSFPNGVVVSPADVVVVAGEATTFFGVWGFQPDLEFTDTAPSVPQLTPYAGWSGATHLLGNFADEVLLLDRWDTVVDALVYGSGAFAGVTAAGVAGEDESFARTPYSVDRDSCAADFVILSPATPGALPVLDAGDPRPARLSLSAPRPNPARGPVAFTLELPEPARVRVAVHDAAGRLVRELRSGELPAGPHRLTWDQRNADATRVASGRYWLRVAMGDRTLARAFVVLE